MGRPGITLLIPTFNAGPEFPALFGCMQAQRVDRDVEILVIDSGSTDGTVEFLRSRPIRLIEIPNAEFNHGLTRNLGIREARGDIVVLVVQDARPADDRWMQHLVDCFADPGVAGAYSRQLPRPDANPFIRDRMSGWMAAAATPRLQSIESRAEFDALPPLQKLARVAFDNVSSSVRRRTALEIPFRECRFGEDLDWAHRALLAGYRIVYEPRSRVTHSHDHSMWYELKRVYLDHQNLHRLFGVATVPRWRDLLWSTAGGARRLARAVAEDRSLDPASRLRWWARAIPYSFTQSLAQFLGARSVAALARQRRLYQRLDRLLGTGV
jgi:glycosyltransferase involved in cell wall biosynthesis